MNEIKRQLNQKMGDTSNSTASVILKIEAGKKAKRTAKNSKSSGLIYITFASFVTVLALFFLLGPWNKGAPTTITDPKLNEENPIQEEPEEISYKETLRNFFKKNGDNAYFHGKGNEYASFNEQTNWLSEDYVQIILDNGGSMTQNIYRVTDTAIELLVAEYAEENYTTRTLEELDQLNAVEIILQAPFEDGKVFDGKTMYINVDIETIYGQFKAVMTEDNENPIKRYFVEGLGLVAERYEMEDGYVVETYLASVNTDVNVDPKQTITIYNETTKEDETHLVSSFYGIDAFYYKLYPERYNVTYRMLKNVEDGEFGVFMYNCNEQEQCTFEFVHKKASTFTPLSVYTHSNYGNVTFSPNNQYAAVPIFGSETKYTSDSSTTIEVPRILIVDLLEMRRYEEHSIFNTSTYLPIVSHTWVNEKTLTIRVADIPNDNHEAIYEWQNGDKKTREIVINLP